MTDAKVCSKCDQLKPFPESFYTYKDRYGQTKHMAKCKQCHAAVAIAWRRRNPEASRAIEKRHYPRKIRRKYGLSDEQMLLMEIASNGRCFVCGGPPGDRGLFVDHDHETGDVRGLLCQPCNSGLGNFRDDPALLLRAIRYLRTEPSWPKAELA